MNMKTFRKFLSKHYTLTLLTIISISIAVIYFDFKLFLNKSNFCQLYPNISTLVLIVVLPILLITLIMGSRLQIIITSIIMLLPLCKVIFYSGLLMTLYYIIPLFVAYVFITLGTTAFTDLIFEDDDK